MAEELERRDGVETVLVLSLKAGSTPPQGIGKVYRIDLKSPRHTLHPSNLEVLLGMAVALGRCRRLFRREGVDAALAFGGYASVPGALAAVSLGKPLFLHEQNVIPGLANRMLAPFARLVAVSFERSLELFPAWRRKGVVTGNPLLLVPKGTERGDALRFFGLESGRRTVGVVGGSQGAASLNRAVLEALPLWRERDDLQVVHSVGRDKYKEHMEAAAKVDTGKLLYRPLEYVERMDLLYGAADIMVCRAGASTVAELAAAGCAAVLVPYPHAAAGHQEANAAVLEEAGGAVVVKDEEMRGGVLAEIVDGLLADEAGLERMKKASRSVGVPDAAGRLADVVLSRVGGEDLGY